MSLTKRDKERQLNELTLIVTGIRLFNRECGKGGEGIDDCKFKKQVQHTEVAEMPLSSLFLRTSKFFIYSWLQFSALPIQLFIHTRDVWKSQVSFLVCKNCPKFGDQVFSYSLTVCGQPELKS